MGTCIALIICNIILINIYYYKEIKLDVIKFWKNIIKMTILFTIPILIIIIIMKLTNLTGIVNFVVYGSIYTIIYCFNAYFLIMNEYEKGLIMDVLRKFKMVK